MVGGSYLGALLLLRDGVEGARWDGMGWEGIDDGGINVCDWCIAGYGMDSFVVCHLARRIQ